MKLACKPATKYPRLIPTSLRVSLAREEQHLDYFHLFHSLRARRNGYLSQLFNIWQRNNNNNRPYQQISSLNFIQPFQYRLVTLHTPLTLPQVGVQTAGLLGNMHHTEPQLPLRKNSMPFSYSYSSHRISMIYDQKIR